jgi:large subunit ribosomal protein L29
MNAKDLRERTTGDLKELCESTRKELFQSRMKNATSQLEDTSLLRKARRDLARIETILNERTKQG